MEPEPVKKTGSTTLFTTFCGGSFPVFLLTKLFTYSKMNRSRTNILKKKYLLLHPGSIPEQNEVHPKKIKKKP